MVPAKENKVIEDSEEDFSDISIDFPLLIPQSAVIPAISPAPARAPAVSRIKRPVRPSAKRSRTGKPPSKPTLSFKALLEEEERYQKSQQAEEALEEELRQLRAQAHEDADSVALGLRSRLAPKRRKDIIQRTMTNGDAETAQKVERAMEKVIAAEDSAWYFFDPATTSAPAVPPELPFPDIAPFGWRRDLGNKHTRVVSLGSGKPESVAKKMGIPVCVFKWVLEQLPRESSPIARERYGRVLLACPKRLSDTIEPTTVVRIFVTLGASCDLEDDRTHLVPVVQHRSPYVDREWSILLSVLEFLVDASPALGLPVLVKVGIVVMKMMTDEALMNQPGIWRSCEELLQAIAESCTSDTQWNIFASSLFPVLAVYQVHPLKLSNALCLVDG